MNSVVFGEVLCLIMLCLGFFFFLFQFVFVMSYFISFYNYSFVACFPMKGCGPRWEERWGGDLGRVEKGEIEL